MNIKLTLDALQVLDAIDRKGSFAAAAAALHRVPSALTYTMQKLEQDLGVTVFDRRGHRARLTAAGQELLLQGRHLLEAAQALEARVRRVDSGWEAEIRVAVDNLIPQAQLYPIVRDFTAQECGTALRLSQEVYGGCWDALITGRADLVIGAPGEGPPGGGYRTREMGEVRFAFAVAPDHPLAVQPQPLSAGCIRQYLAVSIADSSRHLAPRTSGLLSGQQVLTVANMETKIAAQRQGLAVGFLPRHLIDKELKSRRLCVLEVEEAKPSMPLLMAWRSNQTGRALKWFLEALTAERLSELLKIN
ncbi:MAG: LysR family transcriptional regulator [Gammaproteobacteria bacterium]|nr:MAG: LysR family transcriptional regulator [Gammaproteobacteria bacterium]